MHFYWHIYKLKQHDFTKLKRFVFPNHESTRLPIEFPMGVTGEGGGISETKGQIIIVFTADLIHVIVIIMTSRRETCVQYIPRNIYIPDSSLFLFSNLVIMNLCQ